MMLNGYGRPLVSRE